MEIWDYCFECGVPLTDDMEEDKDWHHISNCGESFPICHKCYTLAEQGKLPPNCGNCTETMRKPLVTEVGFDIVDWVCSVCGQTIPPLEEL